MINLLYGLIIGILFGFLLQRAHVIRYDKQIGALLLKDMTIVKFMFTAILVAMVGIYLLGDLSLLDISGRPLIMGGVIVGASLFGIGWSMLGYCPGTAWGALGEGRLDALIGILGMITGAALYAEAYPFFARTVLTWGDYGNITIPEALGVNHWFIIIAIVASVILLFRWLEQKNL